MKKLLVFFLPLALGWSAEYNRYSPTPPKKPVQTVTAPVITPPVSPMQTNDYDVILEADFLWWTTTVTDLSYATKYEAIPIGNPSDPAATTMQPKRIYESDWDWSPGVRAAFGFNTNHDGWDVKANWTYFYNTLNNNRKVSSPAATPIAFESNPEGTNLLSNAWSNASTSQSLTTAITTNGAIQMNQVDLEIGRNFWISRHLTLRPYSGVRGHFSHLDFRSKKIFEGTGDSVFVGFADWNDSQKQTFWSVGIVTGLESSWKIYKSLSLFGSGGFSLCYGPFKNKTSFRTLIRSPDQADVLQQTRTRRTHDQIWTIQQIIDLSLGLRIEKTWVNPKFRETFRMIFDFGWETHLYPSYNHLDQTTSDNAEFSQDSSVNTALTSRPSKGNLSLLGLVFRSRFEF
jgi:hypothetical protein